MSYQRVFETEDILLDIDKTASKLIANNCYNSDIGARGIKNYFDRSLKQTIYDIKQLKNKGLLGIKITKDTVDKCALPKYNFK